MKNNTIGIRQLHRDLKNISQKVQKGETFLVLKNSKPVFRIVPTEEREGKYDLEDFQQIQFRSGDGNLSKKIDEILYE